MYTSLIQAIRDMLNICRAEMRHVFHDQGMLIFFVVLPILYPVLYASIYMNEVIREVPVVAVDESHSQLSREFLRNVDATPDVHITTYCADMETAREQMRLRNAYGIIYLPTTFSSDIHTGHQTHVSIFCDMSGLLYYKALLTACTDVSLDMGKDIQITRSNSVSDKQDDIATTPLPYEYVALFNPTNGFASFLIPAVLILIIQQSLVLGIGISTGTSRERRTYHLPILDNSPIGPLRSVLGKSSCYMILYTISSVWLLVCIPRLFGLTQIPQAWDLFLFLIPYLLSCIFFAQTVAIIVRHRESCFPLFVPMSLPLLFISGISWPAAAVPSFWQVVSWLFPSTFGINGFVRLHSMGAVLQDVRIEYIGLWIQTIVFFVTALLVHIYLTQESRTQQP